MSDSTQNRRQFLKTCGLSLLVAGPAAQLAFRSVSRAADQNLVMVKVTDPMAQGVGYIEDAAKVDTKKWPKRAGAEGAKQFCYNCILYQAKGDPKATTAAPCAIFAGKGVAAKGWCNSWALNPKVT